MMKTIAGLTYAQLGESLVQLGYKRKEDDDAIVYRFPPDPDALILLPRLPQDAPVRAIDLLIVQKILDGFGVIDTKDFDLLLARVTEPKTPIAAPAL